MRAICFLLALLPLQSYALCYERYYTLEHLDKQKGRQEIRSVILDTSSQFNSIDNDVVTATIHFVRDGKDFVAEASGVCKLDEASKQVIYKVGYNVKGSCLWNGLEVKFEGKTARDFLGSQIDNLLFEVPSGFEYNNVTEGSTPGSKIAITDYDNTFLVKFDSLESNLGGACEPALKLAYKRSTTRYWNEVILHSIRNDLARPTVTARNLFHLSALMWDIYAAYSPEHKGYYFENIVAPSTNQPKKAREKAMSFAAYTLLKKRYELAPGNTGDIYPQWDVTGDGEADNRINRFLDDAIKRLGYSLEDSSAEANFGRKMANDLMAMQLNDGSDEANNYAGDSGYRLKNLGIADISQSGFRAPLTFPEDSDVFIYFNQVFQDYYGKEPLYISQDKRRHYDRSLTNGHLFADDVDINSWVRLNIPGSIDQGGNSQADEQSPLTLFWGELPTFGDLSDAKSATKVGVYFDPGEHYPIFEENPEQVIKDNLEVIEYSALLNPTEMIDHDFDGDGKPDANPGSKLIDISPRSLGNNPLGTNDGSGHSINPVTNEPYEPNLVKAANYYRSIAEFWADGPSSETPPGHWNTLANYTVDQIENLSLPYQWQGSGESLPREQYELQLYLTLNGALHDAAVVAWGIKGHYQGNRPVTVIRKFAAMAEADPEFAKTLESYSPNVKMVTYKKKTLAASGEIIEKEVQKLAVKAWRGPREHAFYMADFDGGGLVELRDFSFRMRDELALSEKGFFTQHSGVGWILAENWLPYQRQTFVTPPFPGFVSGHSTFSRAAAEVLAGVTGTPFFPGGLGRYKAPKLHFEWDETEEFEFHWATYYDASDVSGISRIYGGIHAKYDDLPARKIGSKVGKKALEKASRFFQ